MMQSLSPSVRNDLSSLEPTKEEARLTKFLTTIYEFLTLQDLASVFQVNKRFSEFISLEPALFVYLTKTYYLSVENPHPNLRKYFKILMKKFSDHEHKSLPSNYEEILESTKFRLQLTKNLVRNPYGNKGFTGWTDPANPSNTETLNPWVINDDWCCQKHRMHVFASSYHWVPIQCIIKYDDIPVESRALFEKGEAVLKIGTYIAKRWDCPSEGYIIGEVRDVEGSVMFKKKIAKKNEDLPSDNSGDHSTFMLIEMEYWYEEGKKLDSIVITIAGKDCKYWAGNYGTRFSGVFARIDNKISSFDVENGTDNLEVGNEE